MVNPFVLPGKGEREKNPCGFILIFILSPSHEFLFSIMMSYHGGLSENSDNKLHICDNHLGGTEWAWESLNKRQLNGQCVCVWCFHSWVKKGKEERRLVA